VARLLRAFAAPGSGQTGFDMRRMKIFRLLCGFGLLAVLASNVWTMSRWSESRGVYDDVCYLRQAHLFQKYGLGGIDTNIVFDDDDYLKDKQGDRLCGMERREALPLPHLDSGG
jgi:hypothetical protein